MVMISLAGLRFWLGHHGISFTCSVGQVDKKKHRTPATLLQSSCWQNPRPGIPLCGLSADGLGLGCHPLSESQLSKLPAAHKQPHHPLALSRV